MTADQKLLPCPFCGGRRIDANFSLGQDMKGGYTYSAGCWKCSATGPVRTTPERAAEAWNRRATS